jgi:predicted RNA-binding protein YlxR (DUF448 family)
MVQNRKVPLRRCVGCGEMKEKRDLIRILKEDENRITLDPTGRKNGRGAYLCRKQDCLTMAVKNRGLERSLKCRIDSAVYQALSEELREAES